MNFIYKFVNLFLCYLCVSTQENETQFKLFEMDQLYFIENESYSFDFSTIHISFQDEQDLYRKLNNLSFMNLIEKQQELNLGFLGNSTLLTFLRNQAQYIDICALQNQIIDCKIRINNTLYNDDIIINELSYDPIHLPSKSCYNAFVIDDDSFLIYCQSSINQLQFVILNDKSLILDEILIDLPHNCRYDSKFQFNQIFVYSINCEITTILVIEIINKNQKSIFNHNYTKLHELNNYPKQQLNLIDLKICDSTQILLIFDILMYIFYYKNQNFALYQIEYKPWFIYFESSCFPYVMKGLYQVRTNADYYSLSIDNIINKESQIKKIQYFNNIFFFLYENQTEVFYGNLFKQTIFNVKQIQPLNTLPFMVILDQNNNISIYQTKCLAKIIKYENFPYVGIFQKSLFGYSSNQVILYYQTIFYSTEQPLKAPFIDDIKITQNQIHNNTFQIDTNALFFKSSLFYLDLEFDFNNVFKEQTNEQIIMYQSLLRISKILKIFSSEINSASIVYEDLNGKIFVSLQNGNLQENYYIMRSNSLISVEFLNEESDIFILFIGNYQITKYKIVDKQLLILIHTVMTKKKINEYKLEHDSLICLFDGNTVNSYKFGVWYGYYVEQIQEIQQFRLKNKVEKYDDFRVPYLKINYEDSLLEIKPIFPLFNNIVISVKGQILNSHIFVLQFRILLIVQNEDQIQLQIYSFSLNQISFLYQMPLYKFQIQFPIQIRYFEKLFGLITTKDKQDYLFVYDVSQQGRFCLIQITKMRPNYNNFDLIDKTGIYIQMFSDKIVITYPIIYVSINQSKQFDHTQILQVLQFQTKSFIEYIPTSFNISLYLQNFNNNLRFKFNVEKQMLFINSQNEITNIDSIYGSINNLYLSNSSEGFIQEPIQIIQSQLTYCWIIQQQFCIKKKRQLVYDPFTSQRNFELNDNQIFLNDLLSSYQKILLVYDTNINSIGAFTISKNDQIEQNLNDPTFYTEFQTNIIYKDFQSIRQVNNVFVIYANQFVFLYTLIENYLQYTGECQIRGETKVQVEFLLINDSFLILLILDEHYDLNLIVCRQNIDEIIQNEFNPFFKIGAFYILHSEISNQEIHIIVILFSPTDWGYIYELTFDTINFKLQKQQMIQNLRYLNISFENFQRLTDTTFLLKGKSNSSISSYFYKINLNSSSSEVQLIDYFYKYEQDHEIQYYNETHFTLTDQSQKEKIISLITIDYYKVFTQNNCNLVLQNDVSMLNLIIIKEGDVLIKSQATLYLVIVNFLLIIFFIKKNLKHHPACHQNQ